MKKDKIIEEVLETMNTYTLISILSGIHFRLEIPEKTPGYIRHLSICRVTRETLKLNGYPSSHLSDLFEKWVYLYSPEDKSSSPYFYPLSKDYLPHRREIIGHMVRDVTNHIPTNMYKRQKQ